MKMKIEKIQIAPEARIEDAVVVWPEQKGNVQIVSAINGKEEFCLPDGSLKVIYAFNFLSRFPLEEVSGVLSKLHGLLAPGGQLYLCENDLDYLMRAVVGGDLSAGEFNDSFIAQSYLNRELTISLLEKAGFRQDNMAEWFDNLKFEKRHFEFVISAIKK